MHTIPAYMAKDLPASHECITSRIPDSRSKSLENGTGIINTCNYSVPVNRHYEAMLWASSTNGNDATSTDWFTDGGLAIHVVHSP
jgi:hypothetical protein